MKHICMTAIAALLLLASVVSATTPPDAINFQSVLRDASGNPLDGVYDMTFRLFDAAAGGNEIFVDEHLGAGTGAVTASGGLVTVAIGSGNAFDGSAVLPGDPYTYLGGVFWDFTDVWVEIEIEGETLNPRVKVVSAGHAMNAENAEFLSGFSPIQFMRTDTSTATSGSVTAQTLFAHADVFVGLTNSGSVFFEDGGVPTAASIGYHNINDVFEFSHSVEVDGAVTATNGLNVTVGSVATEDGIFINPDGPNATRSIYFYTDASPTGAAITWDSPNDRFAMTGGLEVTGNAFTTGSLYADQHLFINQDGPDGDRHIFFYEDGFATAESFYWNNAADAFYVTDGFYATGELRTLSSQIVINDDGPNSQQDIEFYNNGTQTERFQWDVVAERFEVSDDFYVFGALGADVKNFVQNHPYREDLEIVYTSLEGNEVTTFTRGTSRLIDGEARIELEESFRFVTNPDIGLSAHLTPRGAASDLYVESISTRELVVRSDGGADVAFDFVVYGLRVGYEDHPVYREKRAEAFAPPLDHFDPEFKASPELRAHTARQRYQEMNRDAFGKTATEMPGALALREAIGMRELNLDYPRGSAISQREMNRLALEAEREAEKAALQQESDAPSVRQESPNSAAPQRGHAQDVAIAHRGPAMPAPVKDLPGRRGNDLNVPVDRPVEPGDVLVIDPLGTGGTTLARAAGDTTVFGVVAESGKVSPPSGETGEGPRLETSVAVTGIVLCKVDAAWGPIRPGDLLTTSPTPGHAMRSERPGIGSVLGKAMEPLDVGTGRIKVLVTLR